MSTWNWQLPNWPNWKFNINNDKEIDFLKNASFVAGGLHYLDKNSVDKIHIELLSQEAYKTSEIEGEFLNRESIQASLKNQLGLFSKDDIHISKSELGISELTVTVFKNFEKKLSHNFLFSMHLSLLRHNKYIRSGKYRNHDDPMQIISGNLAHPKVHYEAPPSKSIKKQMDLFINWYNKTIPSATEPLNCLTRSAIAHFWFEAIHPFEDGNGRIGRALVIKILSEHLKSPSLISLSSVIEENKKVYYQQLANHNKTLNITAWIDYFSDLILEAQQKTISLINFIMRKNEILNFPGINKRQIRVLKRVFKEGPNGFKGGLSASNYMSISKASRATATRDLVDLIEKNIFFKQGDFKSARYYLKPKL